jgi:hypothetical protein
MKAVDDPLSELAREGARRILAQVLIAEADSLGAHVAPIAHLSATDFDRPHPGLDCSMRPMAMTHDAVAAHPAISDPSTWRQRHLVRGRCQPRRVRSGTAAEADPL